MQEERRSHRNRREGHFPIVLASERPATFPYRSYTQFSTLRPGTWRNSFALLVIKRAPRLKACAAISMSSGPMGRPFFSNMALRSP